MNALITAPNRAHLHDCFAPEIRSSKRCSVTMTQRKKDLEFNLTSQDPTALRASLNSILRLLIIEEKING